MRRDQPRVLAGLAAAVVAVVSGLPPVGLGVRAASVPGTISTFAGGNDMGDGVPATGGTLREPFGIGVDGGHNLYIADNGHFRIRKVTPGADGVIGGASDTDDGITTVVGNGTSCSNPSASSGPCGDGGSAASASVAPNGVAIDSAGNVYIADTADNRVRFVCEQAGGCITTGAPANVALGNISTIAGNGTQNEGSGMSGDGAAATRASVNEPVAVAFDSAGNLYIGDSPSFGSGPGGTVRFVCVASATCTTSAGAVAKGNIVTIAGNAGAAGLTTADNVPATTAAVYGPLGVTVDSAGNMYESEGRGVIREVCEQAGGCSVTGVGLVAFGNIATVASSSQTGSDLWHPTQIQAAGSGASTVLYVADHGASSASKSWVYTYNLSTGSFRVIAGTGVAGFSGDGGPATSAQLNQPSGVALDGSFVYVDDAQNLRIRKVNASGTISTVAGNGATFSLGDGNQAAQAGLSGPRAAVPDNNGNIYIADTLDHRIRKVSGAGVIGTVAGTGPNNSATGGYGGDGGPAVSAQLNGPMGLKLDNSGNLYFADVGNSRVRFVCMQSTSCATAFGSVPAGFIITIAGGANPMPGVGDGGLATQGALNQPAAVAIDGAGNLYIADTYNRRVRFVCMQPSSSCATPFGAVLPGNITTVAGSGTSGYTGDGGVATSAEMITPSSVAVAGTAGFYVGDANGQVVRFVCMQATICGTPLGIVPSGFITTVVGNGTACAFGSTTCGDGGAATSAGVNGPAVSVDGAGNLYVADSGNNAVRLVCMMASCPLYPPSPSSIAQGVITTIAGSGPQGLSGDGGPAGAASLSAPYSPAFDASGNMYFADSNNNRVRQVTAPVALQAYPTPLFAGFASQQVGVSGDTQTITLQNPTSGTIVVNNAGATTPGVAISGTDAGDYSLTIDGCSGASIAAGGSCIVKVRYAPQGFGRRTATLTFSDSGGPTSSQTAELVGLADSTEVGVIDSAGALHVSQDGQPFQNLGGTMGAPAAMVSVPAGPGSTPMVLYITIGSDGLYVRSDALGWQRLSTIPMSCRDTVGAVVSPGGGRGFTLTVACEGTDSGLYFAQAAVTAGTLPQVSSWTGLGGLLDAGPQVTYVGSTLYFIVVGTGGQLWQTTPAGGYTMLNGNCIARPATASNGATAYLACHGRDDALWYSVNSGSGWSGFVSLGGVLRDAPGLALTTTQVTFFVVGSTRALYHRLVPVGSSVAGPYVNDGGTFIPGPEAVGKLGS